MVNPKPGSQAFAVLAFLARNPGSTAEEIAGGLRPAYQPTGQGWQAELGQLRQRVLASRDTTQRTLSRLTEAGLVLPVQPYRLAPWWLEKYGTIERGVARLDWGEEEEEEILDPSESESVACLILWRVAKGPGSAQGILGARPAGHTKRVWARLQELGVVEGGRQREISTAGRALVDREEAEEAP